MIYTWQSNYYNTLAQTKTHINAKMMYNRLKDVGGRVCRPNPDTGFSFVAGRVICRPLNSKRMRKGTSAMGKMSRDKGKRGELDLVHTLQCLGFNGVHRAQQYCGAASSADILGLSGVHPECKRTEALRLYDAMEQAIRDSTGTDDMPAVFHRKSQKGWLVIMRLEDWAALYNAYVHDKV